ncbi:senescence-associated gene 12, partial [Prunus dulcis]
HHLTKFMMRKPCWRDMKTGWLNLGQFFYKDAEEKERQFMIFKANLEFIKAFNKHMSQNYFTLSLNQFADLTNEEFWEIPNGYTKRSSKSIMSNSTKATLDWREKGAVTPIKDHGKCGKVLLGILAVAATKGVNKLKTRNLISLSEQELVDYDTIGKDHGCEGGLMDDAFQFIQRNKG